ncbi:tyrosine-protein phosphatase [Alloiococcus sp. CFN-8]|uniref:tyrosine-protein phosphatase n=1 Tax=Alloiococcus sp. CFN-8 TaxID=3416081 RepID=UPI003CF63823
MTRIDFHSHILWNVDDGSLSKEMTLDMLSISEEERVEYICATPHYIINEQEIALEDYKERFELLTEAYKGNVNLIPGLELYMHPKLPEYFKQGKIFGLNKEKYMLIELPMRDFPIYTRDVFYELSILGVKPILAHPERNLKIQQSPTFLMELIDDGVLAQVNAGSLLGVYGQAAKDSAELFVKNNMIHLLGSDAHNNQRRSPRISKAYRRLKELNPELYTWINNNNESIIKGEDVHPLAIIRQQHKESFLKKLFKKS